MIERVLHDFRQTITHDQVLRNGVIGMWEPESLGRSRSYFGEEFLYPLDAEMRDFRRLRARVNFGTVEHQNANCDSPFAIIKPF